MSTKLCTRCCVLKPVTEFSPSALARGQGCRPCRTSASRAYYAANKARIKINMAKYQEKHKEELSRRSREKYLQKREHVLVAVRQYRAKNLSKIRAYDKMRGARDKQKKAFWQKNRLADPVHKLRHALRTRLNSALKKSQKCGSAVRLLGCSVLELKRHLEAQFQPGMSWDNHSRHGWHIDHIRPISSFDLQDPEQLAQACHYTNLQPLWALDNIRKGATYDVAS